uniref:Uncharacterized protein n=1 Tax=Marmota marmota marmota TaxID=9994 RepID=A0A8C6A490_MARMA
MCSEGKSQGQSGCIVANHICSHGHPAERKGDQGKNHTSPMFYMNCVAQAGLQLLKSSDPPASISQVAGTTNVPGQHGSSWRREEGRKSRKRADSV